MPKPNIVTISLMHHMVPVKKCAFLLLDFSLLWIIQITSQTCFLLRFYDHILQPMINCISKTIFSDKVA